MEKLKAVWQSIDQGVHKNAWKCLLFSIFIFSVFIAWLIYFRGLPNSVDSRVLGFRDLMELLYFISGIFLCIAAFWALRQLDIQRESIKTNHKLDAQKYSVEICNNYMRECLQTRNKIVAQMKMHGVSIYSGDSESEELQWFQDFDSKFKDIFPDCSEPSSEVFYNFLRHLELIALVIHSKAADERLCYDGIAQSYCETIKMFYPFVTKELVPNWKNLHILVLYQEWKSKLESSQ